MKLLKTLNTYTEEQFSGTVTPDVSGTPVVAAGGSNNDTTLQKVWQQKADHVFPYYTNVLKLFESEPADVSAEFPLPSRKVSVRYWKNKGAAVKKDALPSSDEGETILSSVTGMQEVWTEIGLKYFRDTKSFTLSETHADTMYTVTNLIPLILENIGEQLATYIGSVLQSNVYTNTVTLTSTEDAFGRNDLKPVIKKIKKLGAKNPKVLINSDYSTELASKVVFTTEGQTDTQVTGELRPILGASIYDTNYGWFDSVVGIATTGKGFKYASRIPNRTGFKLIDQIFTVADPLTNITVQIFTWGDVNSGNMYVTGEVLFGCAAIEGLKDHVIRILPKAA